MRKARLASERYRLRPLHDTGIAHPSIFEFILQLSKTVDTYSRPPIRRIARPPTPQLSWYLNSRATHARVLLPAALAYVPFVFVLVRVRVRYLLASRPASRRLVDRGAATKALF